MNEVFMKTTSGDLNISPPLMDFAASSFSVTPTFVDYHYPPTKSEGYSFGVVRASVRPSIPSVHTFCLSGTISQYLLVRFNSFLVQMICTMTSRYPISLVKIDPLTLELLPLF